MIGMNGLHKHEQNIQIRRFSLNVWCGLIGDLLIGPFVLEQCLTAANYLHFLVIELPVSLENMPLETRLRMFFQHDGMPPHFGYQVMPHLNQSYENWWFGHASPMPWLPRSLDFTLLNFLLWDLMKKRSVRPSTEENGTVMSSLECCC
jgi:hypothetical protein